MRVESLELRAQVREAMAATITALLLLDACSPLAYVVAIDEQINVVTDDTVRGHPSAGALLPRVRGMKLRVARNYRPRPIDSWVQFADDQQGVPYFYDLRTEESSDDFPPLPSLPVCVLPQRALEPSAQQLAAAGAKMWTHIYGARRRRRAAAAIASSRPAPLACGRRTRAAPRIPSSRLA